MVWATDVSADALDVARANIAGCAATRVRTADGLVVRRAARRPARPARAHRVEPAVRRRGRGAPTLPGEVADYEPRGALVSGPTGREALEYLLAHAREWLVPDGALVCELAPHQADAMIERARDLGYADAFVRTDLAGRPRVLVARAG